MLRLITIILIILIFLLFDLYCTDSFIVSDIWVDALIKVNGDTGDREQLTGSWLQYPDFIISDNQNNYYVTEQRRSYLLKVNESNVSIISADISSGMPRGGGTPRFGPGDLEIVNDFLYSDGGDRIYKIDIPTGDRIIISANGVGQGPEYYAIRGLVYNNNYFYALHYDYQNKYSIYKIDIDNGNREIISSDTIGTGPSLDGFTKIEKENNGNLVVLCPVLGTLRIQPDTGNREVVTSGINSPEPRGSGPQLENATGLKVGDDGYIYICDRYVESIFQVDPQTGDRAIIWTCPYPGSLFIEMTINADGDFVLADEMISSLVVVNKTDFTHKIIQSVYFTPEEKTFGIDWTSISGPQAYQDNVYFCYGNKLYKYYMKLKNIQIVTSNDVGSGPLLGNTCGLGTVDDEGYPIILSNGCVMRVNPNTGDRELISGISTSPYPKGEGFDNAGAECIDYDGNYLFTGVIYPWEPSTYFIGKVYKDTGNRELLVYYFIRNIMLDIDNQIIGLRPYAPYIDKLVKLRRDPWQVEDISILLSASTDGLCLDSNNNYIVTDCYFDSVYKIDRVTKEKTIISDYESGYNPPTLIGYGPIFQLPKGITLLTPATSISANVWEFYE